MENAFVEENVFQARALEKTIEKVPRDVNALKLQSFQTM
jgi:hypothetical protein